MHACMRWCGIEELLEALAPWHAALASGANGHGHAQAAAHAGSAGSWVDAEWQQGCA